MQISWILPLILFWHYELTCLCTIIWVMLAVTNVERLETPSYVNANVPKYIVWCLLGCSCGFCSWKFPIKFQGEVVLYTRLDQIIIHFSFRNDKLPQTETLFLLILKIQTRNFKPCHPALHFCSTSLCCMLTKRLLFHQNSS